MKKIKTKKEKKEKWGDLSQLIGGKQTVSESIFVLGETGVWIVWEWDAHSSRRYLEPRYRLQAYTGFVTASNILEWKSHCDARARTWTEDIVAVHATCIAAAIGGFDWKDREIES